MTTVKESSFLVSNNRIIHFKIVKIFLKFNKRFWMGREHIIILIRTPGHRYK